MVCYVTVGFKSFFDFTAHTYNQRKWVHAQNSVYQVFSSTPPNWNTWETRLDYFHTGNSDFLIEKRHILATSDLQGSKLLRTWSHTLRISKPQIKII